MSTVLELLFDCANRRLRQLGLLGVLIGLPVIFYVEIPLEAATVQSELQGIGRHALNTLHQQQVEHQRDRERRRSRAPTER